MFFRNFLVFSYDPTDFGNLTSGSFAFSKSSLNIWKFLVHVLLKPSLENFEHSFTSLWDECICAEVWIFFGVALLCDWNENGLFSVLWPLWVFQICWHIECSNLTTSSFRIWNSSARIPQPLLALLIMMLPKAQLCMAPSDNHFAFLNFLSLGVVLINDTVHSSSGTLSIWSNPWIYLSLLLYNHKGFDLGHT